MQRSNIGKLMLTHNSVTKQFTQADLIRYGETYALEYRFPESHHADNTSHCVLRGHINTLSTRQGMHLVHSEVDVLETYESTTLNPDPLLMIAMLEGDVCLKLGSDTFHLSQRTALTLQLPKEALLEAFQRPDQHLKVITLSLSREAMDHLKADPKSRHLCQHWPVPPHLVQGFQVAHTNPFSSLILEGLSLQLLAHGLSHTSYQPPSDRRLTPSERRRLEQVRALLDSHPEQDHNLTGLAALAAMSPSSLRSKFKSLYGQSVYHYLKSRRLEQARSLLLSGYSVQQVAHQVGYGHASNFTTAFRAHFGQSPGNLVRQSCHFS